MKCLDVVQGGKAKLSAHMGELVESDFTHKSENTQPRKASQSRKVSSVTTNVCLLSKPQMPLCMPCLDLRPSELCELCVLYNK